jgi:3-hydroxyisobutyrate dehydrogenase
MAKTIAFLGVGAMGARMSKNLVDAGFDVRGYSPSESTRAAAEERGVPTVTSSAEAADGADLILSCVPATEHMIATYLGPQGAFETARSGAVCFDFSTVSVAGSLQVAQEAQQRGLSFLDTPVAGSTPQAEKGALAVMVGGDQAVAEAHRDVLDVVGGSVSYFGENGSGLKMKFVTNLILGVHMTAIAEGINLGVRSGLDPTAMLDFLPNTSIPRLLTARAKQLTERSYPAGFPVELLSKDLSLILNAAEQVQMPLPLGSITKQLLVRADALGHAKSDMSAVSEVYT